MAITVHKKKLGAFYWVNSGDDLVLANLVNRLRTFSYINPETVDSLSGSKSSTFTQSQLDDNFKFTTSSDVTVTAADFLDSNWLAKGWTTGTDSTFNTELETFIENNFGQTSVNPGQSDLVVVITRGNIGGLDYSIPFCFHGNKGDPVNTSVDDETSLLLHFEDNSDDSSFYANVSTGVGTIAYVTGQFGKAIDFSSNDSRLNIESGTAGGIFDFENGDFTIDCWLKPIDISSSHNHFLNRLAAFTNNDWYWIILAGGTVRFSVPNLGITMDGDPPGGGGIINNGNWHHLAVVRNGTDLRMYFNGTSFINTTISSAVPFTPSVKLGIGSLSDNISIDRYKGYMDELRISKGIARWTSNFTPPAAPY